MDNLDSNSRENNGQDNSEPDKDGCSTRCCPDYPACKAYCPFFWD